MSATRTERLLALALVLLNASRPLTRSELRAAVRDYPKDVSQASFERMFERDKDELRSMGLPVNAVEIEGPEGIGYVVKYQDAFLPPIEATEDERLALAMAARVWQGANWSHAATSAIRKLELVGNFEANASSPFILSFPVDSELLTSLITAIDHRQRVTFAYRGTSDASGQQRTVEPWAVAAANGSWYLIGLDVAKQAQRAYRLSRITDEVKANPGVGSYEIPNDVRIDNLTAFARSDSDAVTVTVRLFDAGMNTLRAMAIEQSGDVVTIKFPNRNAALSQILRAGPAAAVVAPDDLRNEATAILRVLAAGPTSAATDADLASLSEAVKSHSRTISETSTIQLGRLLAMIPWLRAHPGVTYETAAAHFGTTVKKLRRDLTLAVCTEFGSNLLTLDIDAWDNSIYVRDSRGIDAPLQLTESEVFSLLVGLNLLTQAVPFEQVGAIQSISEKLQSAIGATAPLQNHVLVAVAPEDSADVLEQIGTAFQAKKALALSYISGTDTPSQRIVDPIALIDTGQQRYLHAWCRDAEAVRLFRLDRIQAINVTDSDLTIPVDIEPITAVEPSGADIVLRVSPSARWWTETIPVRGLIDEATGSQLLQTVAASPEWAIRAVMAMGGQVSVIEPKDIAVAIAERAINSLARYPS